MGWTFSIHASPILWNNKHKKTTKFMNITTYQNQENNHTSRSSAFSDAISRECESMSMPITCLLDIKKKLTAVQIYTNGKTIILKSLKHLLEFLIMSNYVLRYRIWFKLRGLWRQPKGDATYSAPKRAAAAPNVPQPQPRSATTLLLTSPNEFSAWYTFIMLPTKTKRNKQCKK